MWGGINISFRNFTDIMCRTIRSICHHLVDIEMVHAWLNATSIAVMGNSKLTMFLVKKLFINAEFSC